MKWDAETADREFSLFIRERDGRCMNPKCVCGLNYPGAPIKELECSHFYSRGIWITRFDPKNCIALGRQCHQIWEQDKQGRYREFMIRWLGIAKYRGLVKKVEDYQYKNIPAISKDAMIKKCRKFIEHEKNKRGSVDYVAEPLGP